MSKISLSPSPTGSAVYTIASPAGSTDRTLTLPDVTGGEFIVSNASGNVGIGTSSPVVRLDVNGAINIANGNNLTWGGAYAAGIPVIFAATTGSGSPFITLRPTGSSSGTGINLPSSGDLQFNSGYGSVATAYGCRAWVNFNGTGTVAIRASGNVSSISDNGTGDYTVNFTSAMPDANYSFSLNANRSTRALGLITGAVAAPTVSSLRFSTIEYTSSQSDSLDTTVAIFR